MAKEMQLRKSGSTKSTFIGKKKKKSKENNNDKATFTLDEVLGLGGEKNDYDKLFDVDKNSEEEIEIQDADLPDIENVENLQKDIEDFMGQLGFQNITVPKHQAEKVTDADHTEDQKVQKKLKIQGDINKEKKLRQLKEEHSTPLLSVDIDAITKKIKLENYNQMLLKDCTPWHEKTSQIPRKDSCVSRDQADAIYRTVESYWEREVELYQNIKSNDKSSDAQWLRTVLKSGTLADKNAALTMLTQESPIHCLRSLETLMNLSKKKARREALVAIDSLRHLWISDLLPNTKLKQFHQNCIENIKDLTDNGSEESQLKLLMTFLFEDKLKRIYADFIDTIKTLSKDSLVNIRRKVIGIVYELLVMKPEQEQVLLSILVNKLGDLDKIVSSKACYLLLQLVLKHPNMKEIVIGEVERMIFRPNVSQKAQYYGVCFLNQIPLSHAVQNVASKLISIYFSFFKEMKINKQLHIFISQFNNKRILIHNDVRALHDNPKKIAVSRQVSNKKDTSSNAQTTKLLSALLTGVNRAYPFTEGEDDLYEEQLNTLFKLAHTKHLATSIQAFMLIYQVMEAKKTVSDRFYQALYEKLVDPDINTSSRQTMLLNLIFKSIRDDPTLKRVKSFIKRLLQVSSQSTSSFLCGILFLLSEVIKKKPGVKSMMNQPEDDEDEEEHFVDAPDDDDSNGIMYSDDDVSPNNSNNDRMIDKKDDDDTEKTSSVKSAWTFRNEEGEKHCYNLQARNPLYSGAEFSCAWELVPIVKHFHPSAGHFGMSLLQGEDIVYKGDPLHDLTLLQFLDRFMYRNPKQKEKNHGSSLMQRTDISARLKEQPVNSKGFLNRSEEKIREDELFFYRYFKMKDGAKKDLPTSKYEENPEKSDDETQLDDFDFASEMKKQKTKSKAKDGNVNSDEDEEDDDDDVNDDEEESDFEFNFSDLENESEDDFGGMDGKKDFSDKDYEEALFSQLNSDGESIDGDTEGESAQFQGERENMFAAADEFAHLLENSSTNNGDYVTSVHSKQQQWEERNDSRKNRWKSNKDKKKDGRPNRTKIGVKRKRFTKGPVKSKRKK